MTSQLMWCNVSAVELNATLQLLVIYRYDKANIAISEETSKESLIFSSLLQTQTILQHFYKLLMWRIFTNSNMSLLLTSHFLF